MLDECIEYLENRAARDSAFKYEVIVVSDGSKDKTVYVAHKYSERYTSEKVRVLNLIENRGKGGAVRLVCWKFIVSDHKFFLRRFQSFFFLSGYAKRPRSSSLVCRC